MTRIEIETLQRFRNLSVEAANSLWAIQRKKEPAHDIHRVNQDIHNLLPAIDAMIAKLCHDEKIPKSRHEHR